METIPYVFLLHGRKKKIRELILWKNKKMLNFDYLNDRKKCIENSNDIEEYNSTKKQQILIVLIADMLNNKKLNPIVTKLFITGRKLNISLVFITQSYCCVQKIYGWI